jgi:ParB/RepB/Spo0J family partition protein
MTSHTPIPQGAPATPAIVLVPLDQLHESAGNTRRIFDQAALDDLALSIRQQGVLVPLLARPVDGHYELIAGARRLRAAKAIGLAEVPVIVRALEDQAAGDTALVENLQRQDITPLEEALALQALMASQTGLDGAHAVSRRIGKDARYVWERLQLLALIPPAQALLEERRFTVAHAIVLSRLTPEQQAKAIMPDGDGGLFTHEARLFLDDDTEDAARERDPYFDQKAVSVREFEAWVAKHIRFDVSQAAAAAPLDFGAVAEQVETAAAKPGRGKKVVHISHDYHVQLDARSEERTFCHDAWKRADGQEGSQACDKAVLGVVVVGPGQGEAFDVCVHKDCDVHWKAERLKREKAAASRSGGAGPAKQENTRAAEDRKNRERQAKEDASRKAFEAKQPDIIKAIAIAIAEKKPGALSDLVLDSLGNLRYRALAQKYLGAAKTADAIVRHAALVTLLDELGRWNAHAAFPTLVKKAIGLDLAPILKAETASPATKSIQKIRAAKVAKTKGRTQ